METPEQSPANLPFRQWSEDGELSVKMDRESDSPSVSSDFCGQIAGLWPLATVDTLLSSWGYDCESPERWVEIDPILWHHIDTLFSLFTEVERGGPGPLKFRAQNASRDHARANRENLNRMTSERNRLFDNQELEKMDNSRWLAEYTLKWLDSGLRLLEVTKGSAQTNSVDA
jgi:hypothetical protein